MMEKAGEAAMLVGSPLSLLPSQRSAAVIRSWSRSGTSRVRRYLAIRSIGRGGGLLKTTELIRVRRHEEDVLNLIM